MQLARDADDAKIMLADETLLDEHVKKLLANKKKEINDHREYEAARAVAARMQAERNEQDAFCSEQKPDQ